MLVNKLLSGVPDRAVSFFKRTLRPALILFLLALLLSQIYLPSGFGIVKASGSQSLGSLNIGDRVVDNSWEWEFRTGFDYTYEDGDITRPVTWIVVAKDHYGAGSGVTLLSEELIGQHTFDNSSDRGSIDGGSNHWGHSGTTDATRGLRPWLNSTGIHAGEGFYNAFSESFKSGIITTTVPNRKWDGGNYYSTLDKVFISSITELGYTTHSSTYEIGTVFSYFEGAEPEKRVAQLGGNSLCYWTRSPDTFGSTHVRGASQYSCSLLVSDYYYGTSLHSATTVRPALNLKSEIPVSATPNADGAHEILGEVELPQNSFVTEPQVSAGGGHVLALKSDGTVWSWGENREGQLGDGTTVDKHTPVKVSGLTDMVALSSGSYHSLALKSDGTVWAWGENWYGQLGDGTTVDKHTPVKVSGLTDVVALSTGTCYSLALKSDGTVWSWGQNWAGQLGDGTTEDRITPVQVSGLTDVVALSGAEMHSLALKSDGTIWAWGENWYGQLGDGTTVDKHTPVKVSGLADMVALSSGNYHSLALKSDGTVWAWGVNERGQLGDGTTVDRHTPVKVSGLTDVVALNTGSQHSLVLKSDGTVWAWGRNWYGQLGDGTTVDRHTSVKVSGLTDVVALSGAESHSLALKSDGTVWAWGRNSTGQLGDGTTVGSHTPVQSLINLGKIEPSPRPNRPANMKPTTNLNNVATNPTLSSSAFEHPNPAAVHYTTHWQVTTEPGNYSEPVFASEDYTSLTALTVPSYYLEHDTSYYWRIRYRDDLGNWSDWSEETLFKTLQAPHVEFFVTDNTSGYVVLDASASFSNHPDGAINHYFWDLNGDGSYDTSTGTPVLKAWWMKAGNYDVTLAVTDDRGGYSDTTAEINITASWFDRFLQIYASYKEKEQEQMATDLHVQKYVAPSGHFDWYHWRWGRYTDLDEIDKWFRQFTSYDTGERLGWLAGTRYGPEDVITVLEKDVDPEILQRIYGREAKADKIEGYTYMHYILGVIVEEMRVEQAYKLMDHPVSYRWHNLQLLEAWLNLILSLLPSVEDIAIEAMAGQIYPPLAAGYTSFKTAKAIFDFGAEAENMAKAGYMKALSIYLNPAYPAESDQWSQFWKVQVKEAFDKDIYSWEGFLKRVEDKDKTADILAAAEQEFEELYENYQAYGVPGEGLTNAFKRDNRRRVKKLIDSLLKEYDDSLLRKRSYTLNSPAQIRVYDEHGNLSGVKAGIITEEIENAVYIPARKSVVIIEPEDYYYSVIEGGETGFYGMSVGDHKAGNISFNHIAISSGAIHRYNVDWDALANDEVESITLEKDFDGDGVYDETIKSSPPRIPGAPQPAGGAGSVQLNSSLQWTGGSTEDDEEVYYNIYLGNSLTPPLLDTIGPFQPTQTDIAYDPGPLSTGTIYYWRITAANSKGIATEGPLWSFDTIRYSLAVDVYGQGSTEPAVGEAFYDKGSIVTLEAIAESGWQFEKWVVGVNEYKTTNINVTMDTDITATAYFIETDEVEECFIATATYGSKLDPAVILLRQFRDAKLLTNMPGQAFVSFYYNISPPIAEYIAGNHNLKSLLRILLLPVVAAAYLLLKPWVLLLAVLAAYSLYFCRYYNERYNPPSRLQSPHRKPSR